MRWRLPVPVWVACVPAPPARSARGRNLAVLLEIADILFSRGLAMVDRAERLAIEGNAKEIALARQRLAWLGQAALLVQRGLGDRAWLAEVLRQGNALIAAARVGNVAADSSGDAAMFAAAFHSLQAECAQQLESALEALTGIWTGIDTVFSRRQVQGTPLQVRAEQRLRLQLPGALESLRENWTFASSDAPRPAHLGGLRIQRVAGTDAASALRRVDGVYRGHRFAALRCDTWQNSLQRVGGTIAGALLAALLMVFIRPLKPAGHRIHNRVLHPGLVRRRLWVVQLLPDSNLCVADGHTAGTTGA